MSDVATRPAREKSLRVTFISQADEDNALAALQRLSEKLLGEGANKSSRPLVEQGRGWRRPAATHKS
jgi:hypothetical protein